MSDFRLKKLDQFRIGEADDENSYGIPVPRTPSGKIYRFSPNPDAAPRLFLLGDAPEGRSVSADRAARIRRQPGGDETVCPYSGVMAPDEDFLHSADLDSVKKLVAWAAEEEISGMFENMARDFNRRQRRGGPVSVSMSFTGGHNPRPLAIREDLLRDMRCDMCQRAYGVYAIALFCPDCGAPNVALHFMREAELVREQIALADQQAAGDRPELAYRLMGNAHEDVLTAFEATLKAVYCYLIRHDLPEQAPQLCSKKAIGNAFQNIARGRELFSKLQVDPFAGLADDDLDYLRINIQKRHVIGHNLGIADEHYAELTQEEEPGETVRLLGDEIARFSAVCTDVVVALEETLLPNRTVPGAGPAAGAS